MTADPLLSSSHLTSERTARVAALSIGLGLFGIFLATFDPNPPWRPLADLTWFVSILFVAASFYRRPNESTLSPSHKYLLYLVYIAALLPFYNNWRWSMTGDSIPWATGGMVLSEIGPTKSLLSIEGVGSFGYLQMVLHNLFMILFAPTLFWHRFGQIMVGVISFAALYEAFGRLISERFGLLVSFCSMLTPIILVHTFSSYPLLDAIAIGGVTLSLALASDSQPDNRPRWILLGLTSGFGLFLSASAWGGIAGVWIWLAFITIRRRSPVRNYFLALFLALLVGAPILIQLFFGYGSMFMGQGTVRSLSASKVWRLFQEAALLPIHSNIIGAGNFGAFLPIGFRWLVPIGMALSLFSSKTARGGRLMLWLYFFQVAFISVTQGDYESVSVKRAFVLVPFAAYFALLPIYCLSKSGWLLGVSSVTWALLAALTLIFEVRQGTIGYTLLDGIVEASQRLGSEPVCILYPNSGWAPSFAENSALARLYDLQDKIRRVDAIDSACRSLCYAPQLTKLDLLAHGFHEIEMNNTVELRCGISANSQK